MAGKEAPGDRRPRGMAALDRTRLTGDLVSTISWREPADVTARPMGSESRSVAQPGSAPRLGRGGRRCSNPATPTIPIRDLCERGAKLEKHLRTWRADVAESVDAAGLNPAGYSRCEFESRRPHQNRAAPIWRGGRARLNAPASKAGRPARASGVQIPPSPPSGRCLAAEAPAWKVGRRRRFKSCLSVSFCHFFEARPKAGRLISVRRSRFAVARA